MSSAEVCLLGKSSEGVIENARHDKCKQMLVL
jgi:hypothetical protein